MTAGRPLASKNRVYLMHLMNAAQSKQRGSTALTLQRAHHQFRFCDLCSTERFIPAITKE